jgi:hypothetical protein
VTAPALPGVPASVAGWSVTAISGGLWLSTAHADAPAEVLALKAEPGRPTLVVDAQGPDERTDQLIAALFPLLSAQQVPVRLVLSAAAQRYLPAAVAAGLDLIAAEGTVVITPYGHAVVRRGPDDSGSSLPQWRGCLPSGGTEVAGVLAPSAAWERGLAEVPDAAGRHGLTVRRVPAGLGVRLAGQQRDGAEALAAWPDPERITIVRDAAGRHDKSSEPIARGLATLLPMLPLSYSDGVRLHWPRAGAGASAHALEELARSAHADLIVPAGDVSVSGFTAVCHGPMGAAPWLRFTSSGQVEVLGSLHPEPAWERQLAEAELDDLLDAGRAEHIAAGLYLPPSSGDPGGALTATARSIVPDPAMLTVVTSGDVSDHLARQDVESVLQRLPVAAIGGLRLLLARAGTGGPASYAQLLASSFGCVIVAPVGRWTATPDGRAMALPAGSGTGARGETWALFSPLGEQVTSLSGVMTESWPDPIPGSVAPGSVAPGSVPADSVTAPPEPAAPAHPAAPPAETITPSATGPREQPPPAEQGPSAETGRPGEPGPPTGTGRLGEPNLPADAGSPPAAPPPAHAPPADTSPLAGPPAAQAPHAVARVALPPRDHRSSTRERQRYRDSAADYHSHLVAVRRTLTQRPGLRSAAAGDAEDAVVTDFTAVLDVIADDHSRVAAALRSGGSADDPRFACAVSGLRRLPSFTGVVYTSARIEGIPARFYAAGMTVTEPAFVFATSSSRVAPDGDIEYLIWSETGKRLAALVADAGRDEIVFATGTRFRVLNCQPSAGKMRVYLREHVGQQAEQTDTDMDRRVLERLESAASMRAGVSSEDQVASPFVASSQLLIGVDARGALFTAAEADLPVSRLGRAGLWRRTTTARQEGRRAPQGRRGGPTCPRSEPG